MVRHTSCGLFRRRCMKRVFTVLLGLLTTVGLVLVGGEAQAAAPQLQTKVSISAQSRSIVIDATAGGVLIGTSKFNADPSGSIPGDAIQACDWDADGWG